MNHVGKNGLVLSLIFAFMIIVSAQLNTNAAAKPMQFTRTDATDMSSMVVMGEYDFDLYNRTTGWVLNGFYTKENGKWSKNWLTYKLGVGKSVHMTWNAVSNEGACVVPFKTTWDDYDQAELHNLDWCKGIKSIYLKDDTFTVDYK